MLIAELKRRNVFKVATAYMVVGWVVLQIAEFFFESFLAPAWALRSFAVLIILGFPIACLLSWALEVTQEGVARESGSVAAAPRARWYDYLWGVLIVATLIVASANLATRWRGEGESTSQLSEPVVLEDKVSIAVLPFANLSSSEENQFFAAGVHEDILTHLSKIDDLRVISRTSVMQYADSPGKSVVDIGRELNVGRVLEGSVRRAGDRVRVTVQLIDTGDDSHLWSENYDRDLTDIFAVQSEVARQVAQQLRVRLDPKTMARMQTIPTSNMDAYDLYNQANSVINLGTSAGFLERQSLLQQAVELDPGFAKAYAELAYLLALSSTMHAEGWPGLRKRAFAAARQAIDADPLLSDGHAAMGRVLATDGNYGEAERELKVALSLNPNSAGAYFILGEIYFELARVDEARASFRKGLTLDPLDTFAMERLSRLYNYEEEDRGIARELLSRAADLAPATVSSHSFAALLAVNEGDLRSAYNHIHRAVGVDDSNLLAISFLNILLISAGQFDLAQAWVERAEQVAPHNDRVYGMKHSTLRSREYQGVSAPKGGYAQRRSELLEAWRATDSGNLNVAQFSAMEMRELADEAQANGAQEEANQLRRRAQDSLENALETSRDSDGNYTVRSETRAALLAYSAVLIAGGQGARAETILVRLVDDSGGITGYGTQYFRAWAFDLLGKRDEALEALEAAYQNGWSLGWSVDGNPQFNAYRSDPRFIDIVARTKARNRDLHDYIALQQDTAP